VVVRNLHVNRAWCVGWLESVRVDWGWGVEEHVTECGEGGVGGIGEGRCG
jgi:hypothetical protein